MPAAISTAISRAGLPNLRRWRPRSSASPPSFDRSAEDEPLYRIEPLARDGGQCRRSLGGVSPMKVLVNGELQNKTGANASERSTRHIEVATARWHELPGRRSSERGAAQRSGAGGCRGAPLRLSAGRPDPAAGRRRPPRAIAGRRAGLGRAVALRIRRTAAGRDPQADPDHVGAYALPRDQAETAGLCRRGCGLDRALPHWRCLGTRKSVFELAGGTSGLRIAVPRLSRNAVAAGAALLFDFVVAVGRSLRAAASPSPWSRDPASSGRGIYKGVCSNYLPAAAPAK